LLGPPKIFTPAEIQNQPSTQQSVRRKPTHSKSMALRALMKASTHPTIDVLRIRGHQRALPLPRLPPTRDARGSKPPKPLFFLFFPSPLFSSFSPRFSPPRAPPANLAASLPRLASRLACPGVVAAGVPRAPPPSSVDSGRRRHPWTPAAAAVIRAGGRRRPHPRRPPSPTVVGPLPAQPPPHALRGMADEVRRDRPGLATPGRLQALGGRRGALVEATPDPAGDDQVPPIPRRHRSQIRRGATPDPLPIPPTLPPCALLLLARSLSLLTAPRVSHTYQSRSGGCSPRTGGSSGHVLQRRRRPWLKQARAVGRRGAPLAAGQSWLGRVGASTPSPISTRSVTLR